MNINVQLGNFTTIYFTENFEAFTENKTQINPHLGELSVPTPLELFKTLI